MRSGHRIDATMVFGGVSTDANNDITGATAAQLIFYIKNNRVRSSKGGWETPDSEAWEKVWLDVAEGLSLAGINVFRYAGRTRSDEFGNAIKADLTLINVAVVLLVVYCMFTIGRLRRMETRFSITLLGILSVAVAAITGVAVANG